MVSPSAVVCGTLAEVLSFVWPGSSLGRQTETVETGLTAITCTASSLGGDAITTLQAEASRQFFSLFSVRFVQNLKTSKEGWVAAANLLTLIGPSQSCQSLTSSGTSSFITITGMCWIQTDDCAGL